MWINRRYFAAFLFLSFENASQEWTSWPSNYKYMYAVRSFDVLTRVVGRLSCLPLRTMQLVALRFRISFSVQKLSPRLQREDNYEVYVQASGHSLTDQRNPNFFPRTMILPQPQALYAYYIMIIRMISWIWFIPVHRCKTKVYHLCTSEESRMQVLAQTYQYLVCTAAVCQRSFPARRAHT